ncbi:DELLA protein RGL1-like [Asparagus officinalis]|nr:DELLA protein RGL1-like [Asparagus officinalis]
MAIRRFCPERMDQDPDLKDYLFEIETWSSSFDSSSPPCSGCDDEDSSFIDSVINTSLFEELPESTDNGFASYLEDTTMQPVLMDNADPDTAPASINEGLELVHLLLACAEAVACRDTTLAASIFSQIWPLADQNGDSLKRVCFHFAVGLKSRLSLLQTVGVSGSLNTASTNKDNPIVTKEEKMEAFHHLYETTPYISFAFMAANDSICQAAKGKDYLHIVDLGMSHAIQWHNLIQMLASHSEGPPRIRITGITSSDSRISDLESNMKILLKNANTIGVHIEFRIMNESSLLTAENLDIRQGETLVFNSIMHLHRYVKETRGSLKAVLVAIKKLKPELFTIVEQDANHNGPFFLARFLESLHYYSAVFDSLEASLTRSSLRRMKIENSYFADAIRNIIACEGGERVERHERADQWRRQLGRAGFQGVGIESVSQVKMLVSAYNCDGYTTGSEKGCLLLGWKGRPIMWASAWKVNSSHS